MSEIVRRKLRWRMGQSEAEAEAELHTYLLPLSMRMWRNVSRSTAQATTLVLAAMTVAARGARYLVMMMIYEAELRRR
jgi:hypothetical protein